VRERRLGTVGGPNHVRIGRYNSNTNGGTNGSTQYATWVSAIPSGKVHEYVDLGPCSVHEPSCFYV